MNTSMTGKMNGKWGLMDFEMMILDFGRCAKMNFMSSEILSIDNMRLTLLAYKHDLKFFLIHHSE